MGVRYEIKSGDRRRVETRTCRQCGVEFSARTDTLGLFCGNSCRGISARRGRRNTFRQLRAGEAIPPSPPGRYVNHRGYVVLRWTNDRAIVEALEHRVEGDRITLAEHIHHINGIKTDNRPENLQRMTLSEHRRLHALERWNRGGCAAWNIKRRRS